MGHHFGDVRFGVCIKLAFLVSFELAGHLFPLHNKGLSADSQDARVARVVLFINIYVLRGGVAPKSHALVCTGCFILEAPCLGDWPVTSFRWSRVRSSRLAEICKNLKLRILERRESRGLQKPCALAHQVPCPANAEQGMTSLPANDATGHSLLPGRNGMMHDLITCQ